MIAELVEPVRAFSISAAAKASCWPGWASTRACSAQGVEIEADKVRRAIARGVSAYQGDIEQGLADYPDGAFDFVILSQTLQEMRYPLACPARNAACGPPRHRRISEFRPLDRALGPSDQRARAQAPNCFPTIGTNRRICTSSPSTISSCSAGAQNWTIERQNLLPRRHAKSTLLPNLAAEVAVFSIPGRISFNEHVQSTFSTKGALRHTQYIPERSPLSRRTAQVSAHSQHQHASRTQGRCRPRRSVRRRQPAAARHGERRSHPDRQAPAGLCRLAARPRQTHRALLRPLRCAAARSAGTLEVAAL